MFDGWQRYVWDANKKEVVYVKDQVAIPLDRRISVGKPSTMADLKKRTTIFRADGVDMRDDKEVTEYGLRIHKLRTLGGYQPWKVKGE
jgi:methyl-coenzyme M reductase gamma subunit